MDYSELHSKIIRCMEVVADLLRLESEIEKIRVESNTSWLCLDVWPRHPFVPPEMAAPVKFAIWLETAALYRVRHDGAVEDDPITVEDAVKGEWKWV